MEVKELRIGNYVLDDEGTICKICRLQSSEYTAYDGVEEIDVYIQIEDRYFETQFVVGIPLTEEILLKCGFVENGDTSQFHLDEQIVSFNKLDGANFWIMDTDIGIRCKYLHQLQNVWFVHKGKELTVSL